MKRGFRLFWALAVAFGAWSTGFTSFATGGKRLLAVAFALTCTTQVAAAENVPEDPVGTAYTKGAVVASPDEVAGLPEVERFRNYLPVRVDLSRHLPLPGDQGKLGACSAWAVGYAARSFYSSFLEKKSVRQQSNIPSPAYLYQYARAVSLHDQKCEEGSSIVANADVLMNGAESLAKFPYPGPNKCLRGQVRAKTDAFKISGLRRVSKSDLDQIRGRLANNHPVIFSMPISRSFEDLRGAAPFTDTTTSDELHAMLLVGYDDTQQAFRLINSWGRRWGDKGFAWISYGAFSKLAREAFVLDVDAPKIVQPIEPKEPEAKPSLDLAKYSCSELSLVDQVKVVGFVRSAQDLSDLASHIAKVDKRINLSGVHVVPWPECEVWQVLGRSLKASESPSVEIVATKLTEGDALSFSVKMPPRPRYLHVAYVQADGTTKTLYQSSDATQAPLLPSHTMEFGKAETAKFTVSAPYGDEIIVVISSKSLLFDKEQPRSLTEREFLSELKKAALFKADAKMPDRELEAAIVPITTSQGAQR